MHDTFTICNCSKFQLGNIKLQSWCSNRTTASIHATQQYHIICLALYIHMHIYLFIHIYILYTFSINDIFIANYLELANVFNYEAISYI